MLLTHLISIIISLSAHKSVAKPLQDAFRVPDGHLTFQLRHYHALESTTHTNVFLDANPSISIERDQAELTAPHTLSTTRILSHRPTDLNQFQKARAFSRRGKSLSGGVTWESDVITGPNITDRETLLELAKMTNDAYLTPGEAGWYDLGDQWNTSFPVGWEPDADGFRGHVFATPDNSTVILSIKGTSAGLWGSGGPTARKDKLNDNLLWSCCCARVDWTWTTVCGCYSGPGKCDQDCLEDALVEESLFYPVGTNLYNNLTYMYPNSEIWITGHSLGGGLAALLGVTFGRPVVAFESPGDRLAAQRLHLPSPPSTQHVTHVYHTADPVPMGACTGRLSTCWIAGFALETHCHLGKSIVYDTVSNLSWSVDVRTHPIKVVIDQILSLDWEVPQAKFEDDCVECYAWEFGDFQNKSLTTASHLNTYLG